jgi:membrane protein
MSGGGGRKPFINRIIRSVLEGVRDWFIYAYWILYRTGRIFRDERVQFQANALAYRSLIAIVPVLTVLFSFFAWFQGLIGDEENLEKALIDFLSRYLMPHSEILDSIINQILGFVEKAEGLAFIGFALFILSAIFLMSAVERSFNLIWKVEHYRSLTQRFIIFIAVLFLGPLLIGVSVYITGRVQLRNIIEQFTAQDIAHEIPITGVLSQFLDNLQYFGNLVVPYLLMLFTLMILYMAVPNTRVERGAAFIGAAFAAFLWELSKWGFSYFAKSMFGSREIIYGVFAGFFMFLVLMYLVSVIVLFGAELSYVIQNYRYLMRVDPRELRPVSDAYLACRAMVSIAHGYLKGEDLPGVPELAARFHVSIPQMRSVISRLAEVRILVRIGGSGDKGFGKEVYEPNRELDQITFSQVVEAAAGDSFLKPDYDPGKSLVNTRAGDKDMPELSYSRELDSLFREARGDLRELFSRTSLKEFILKSEGS